MIGTGRDIPIPTILKIGNPDPEIPRPNLVGINRDRVKVPTRSQSRNPDPDVSKVRESRSRNSSRDRDLSYPREKCQKWVHSFISISTKLNVLV